MKIGDVAFDDTVVYVVDAVCIVVIVSLAVLIRVKPMPLYRTIINVLSIMAVAVAVGSIIIRAWLA